jgi:hypothetical protein
MPKFPHPRPLVSRSPLVRPVRGKGATPDGLEDVPGLLKALADQALTVVAFYDVRAGVVAPSGSVDSWSDVRGSGFGPTLSNAGAARPTLAADGTFTFDGVAQFLRNAVASSLGAVTGSCAVVMVLRGQTAITGRAAELSVGAATSIIASGQAAGPVWTTKATAAAAMTGNAAVPQVLHSRFKQATEVGTQVGTGAEVTAADATGAATADRLTIGASRIDAATLFAPLAGLCAVLVLAGDYTAKQGTMNAWGRDVYGGTI